MEFAEIKKKMKEVRATTQDLADFMGVEHHKADRIVNGRRKFLTTVEAEALRRFFALRERPVVEATPPPRDVAAAREASGPGASIPLYKAADTADGWMISLAKGSIVMMIPPHPSQLTAREAFAVEIPDAAMSPRFRQGEYAYVAGGLNPKPGQDCLVEYSDLTARVLEFVERDGRRIVLRQLTPPKQVILNAADHPKLHAIVGRG